MTYSTVSPDEVKKLIAALLTIAAALVGVEQTDSIYKRYMRLD